MSANSATMTAQTASMGALAGLRVLDLSRRYGYYCGKLFADMGADVILVEPPRTGVVLRAEAPCLQDRAGHSIAFFNLNTSKRGITLDWQSATGRDLLLRLAAGADLVIEDGAPGTLESAGLGYDALSAGNQRLVLTRITPFGQTGPYSGYAADDLTLLAMGGLLQMMGYPDIAPSQTWGNQAYAMGNMFAAVGSMMAVLAAQASGSGPDGGGQQVDVAMQECVTMALENAAQFYDLEGKVRVRFGDTQRHAGTGVFECADGHLYVFAGGMAAARFWPNFVQWMQDENVPGAAVFREPQWSDIRYVNSDEAKAVFASRFSGYAKARTKKKLYDDAQARRVPLCPVSTPADIAHNDQLAYRSFFTTVHHPDSGADIVMPGAPFKLADTPWRVARPAPRLGEHNAEVFSAIGVAPGELAALAAEGIV